jgi:hypothetical protein|tara:strand:- start:440 stop:655 length:216 start_codon:yes stop_codon:yes gene_type:complete
MREFTIGDYRVEVDTEEGLVTAVWEGEEEILDTLPDSKVFDLMDKAEQQAKGEYEDDLAESRFDDKCYHGS